MLVAVTLPGMGVIVPLPSINPSSGLSISAQTTPGNLSCIYWGEHLTINDSTSSCKIKIKNNTSTPLTLKMTATLNERNATIDATNPIPPNAQGISWNKENTLIPANGSLDAILKLHIPRAMMPPQDMPFETKVTITGA